MHIYIYKLCLYKYDCTYIYICVQVAFSWPRSTCLVPFRRNQIPTSPASPRCTLRGCTWAWIHMETWSSHINLTSFHRRQVFFRYLIMHIKRKKKQPVICLIAVKSWFVYGESCTWKRVARVGFSKVLSTVQCLCMCRIGSEFGIYIR